MGKIEVKGTAKQEFEVDRFKIRITIKASNRLFDETISTGKKRTEQFLEIMRNQLGIQPNDFIAGEYSINSPRDDKDPYRYERSFSATINANLSAVEKISELIKEMSDISFNLDFELSDMESKENDVIRQAVNDSREKAEILAAALGQKIVGAKNCNFECWDKRTEYDEYCSLFEIFSNNNDLASRLKNPVETIQKSVNIVWITE